MIDLNNGIVNLYGPGESGKSNFCRYLFDKPQYHRHIIYDPMKEYDPDNYNVYRPDKINYDNGGNDEVNEFLEYIFSLPPSLRPRYILFDEAANYIPGGNKPMGQHVSELAYHNTHMKPGVTMLTSNRHITDLNGTIREMYSDMFVFGLRGSNSIRQADNLSNGLSDAVEQSGQYEFIHVNQQGDKRHFTKVPDMDEYRSDGLA